MSVVFEALEHIDVLREVETFIDIDVVVELEKPVPGTAPALAIIATANSGRHGRKPVRARRCRGHGNRQKGEGTDTEG